MGVLIITHHERLLEFKKQSGDAFWTPAPLLDRLATEGRGFIG